MAAPLFGGAAVGAAFGELLKAVLDMKERAVTFKPTLAFLQSTLQVISPVIQDIEKYNDDLGNPKEELERLTRAMEEGTKLVCKCSKIQGWNYLKRVRHHDRLVTLMESLIRFFNIDLQAQIAKDVKKTLLEVRRLHSKVNKPPQPTKEETTGLPSSFASMPSELEIHRSTAMQPAGNAKGINSCEQVMEHTSQVTTGSSRDSDPVHVYVSESKTLHSMATQPVENAAESNSAEQVMELITSFVKEDGRLLERNQIMNEFLEVTAKLEQSLDGISFDKLDKSGEVKEQVELFLAQLRIAKGSADALDFEFYEDHLSPDNKSSDASTDLAVLRRLPDITQESIALHEMAEESGGDPGVSIEKIKDHVELENLDVEDNVGGKGLSTSCCKQGTNDRNHQPPIIPDDFRCPISLELMKDPVIVSTGQTYERSYIEKWLEAECCEANGTAERSKIENLLQKLKSGNPEDQRSAAGEIRLLTKYNKDSCVAIAEAGAIPLLVGLLSTPDSCIQVHAVTALLNLSLCENNKASIISSGAVPGIVHMLKKGSMEARENAAATLRSLSTIDENKVTIGSLGAIPPLVMLLSEGSQRGKKDAATTLYNLCFFEDNKAKAVNADVVPTVMQLLTSGGMVEVAWSILTILASHPEGKAAIDNVEAVPILVKVIGNGSPRDKENAADILVQLCSRDQQYLAQAQELGAMDPLLELAHNGTERGKRKATKLIESMVN